MEQDKEQSSKQSRDQSSAQPSNADTTQQTPPVSVAEWGHGQCSWFGVTAAEQAHQKLLATVVSYSPGQPHFKLWCCSQPYCCPAMLPGEARSVLQCEWNAAELTLPRWSS